MKVLLEFELKRLKYRKILMLLPLILITIGIAGILLGSAYHNDFTPKLNMLNVYNAYSQFAFLFLSYIYISVLTEDFSKGYYRFYEQLGYSLSKCLFVKSLILFIISIIVTDLFLIIYSSIINVADAQYIGLMLLSVDLGFLFILFLSNVLALIFKKVTIATVLSFALYIFFDFANLIAYGLTNPCDANSLSCVTFGQLSGLDLTHDSLSKLSLNFVDNSFIFTTLPAIVYCLILLGIITILIKKEIKK